MHLIILSIAFSLALGQQFRFKQEVTAPQPNLVGDTIYIILKNDNPQVNEVRFLPASPTSPTIAGVYIYGFRRNNVSHDVVDSLGYLGANFVIDTTDLGTCPAASCARLLHKKPIDLYDFRDSLKKYIDLSSFKKNRWRLFSDYYPPNGFTSNKDRILILVMEKGNDYHFRRVKGVMYFEKLVD